MYFLFFVFFPFSVFLCSLVCQFLFYFFLVASFDGLRPLLVASHCALCSLANKLRSFVRSGHRTNSWRTKDADAQHRATGAQPPCWATSQKVGYPIRLSLPSSLLSSPFPSFPFPEDPLKPAKGAGERTARPPNGFGKFWGEKIDIWWVVTAVFKRFTEDDIQIHSKLEVFSRKATIKWPEYIRYVV